MRILFVTDSYVPVPSGVTVSVETLRLSLEKLGHDVLIIAPKYPGWNKKEHKVARLPGLFRPFEKFRPSFWPTVALNKSRLKEMKIDLVHSHFNFSLFDYPKELSKYLNIPLVNTIYGFSQGQNKTPTNKKLIAYANCCDLNIALSSTSKQYLSQMTIHSPIDVLPVGVFPKDFTSFPPEAVRKKFDIPKNRKIILYVGAIDSDSSISFLIKAFKKVWKALEDDVHLLIIGGGRYFKKYKSAVAASALREFITFTDYLPKNQVNKIYAVADTLAYTDRLDPQPLVILESLCAGTPVVATRGMGAQNFVKNNEDGLITTYNADDFSEKLIQMLKKDRMRLDFSLKARINARRFRASILTQELVDLYNSTLESFKHKLI